VHDLESMKPLVDDFVARGYFGVIMTGGEPSLHEDLPRIVEYAASRGLHVRMISNGHRLADPGFCRSLGAAGLRLVHVSIYSVWPEVEARLRGTPGTLERAFAALDHAHAAGIEVNVNCVINRLNADHLDENIRYFLLHHPHVRHFVWNNLDPSMGRAEVNQAQFVPRLADFELSLHRAMRLLHRTGRTFRVEKVPLCYMTEFGWASTETRKIVKGEERIVHFLDDKQTVRQTRWGHTYGEACEACSLRSICGGLFDRGDAYDPAELHPVFVDRDAIVSEILRDPDDPSFGPRSLEQWREWFEAQEGSATRPAACPPDSLPGPEYAVERPIPVGRVTERGRQRYEAKRRAEVRRARELGVELEKAAPASPAGPASGRPPERGRQS
jgi:hypothetical protein